MKKTTKQMKKKREKAALSIPSSGAVTEVVRTVGADVAVPPPHYLLELARGEPDRKAIEDYAETIQVLRDEKNFTFREIADWLTENGIETDHNAVYREYTKGMSEREEQDVALREALEERDAKQS